ncbi:hypothetical protein BK659_05140 [Pseudomonas brassicacearum]|uniref:DUF7683 domain-containing protein n=1 Tax=Pseudomonas brassicacearum TaxID=930166 RepID=A0A423HCV5_9PSED|nr:hypothetical protein [Pseudomonas brassicacearum]RON10897.1 hypothetical protein BK659_05140 [Pseudomonas brassicacearum]
MIFSVMGFHPGRDELVFEHGISLSVADLTPVMQWTNTNECIGVDFRLTAAQALEIERLASVVFPEGLDLYLTSSG